MANTTFTGPVRSENGFQTVTKNTSTGAYTVRSSFNAEGTFAGLGTRKIQTFAGTLAGTDAADTAYADGDVLVELGTLNTDAASGLVTPTKFFIHRAVVLITTPAGETLVGSLKLDPVSGTATNAAPSDPTAIVGAGVTCFDPQVSAAASVTEIDINYNNTAGNYHIFDPLITAPIASKFLYACTTTAINADITAGRFTAELEYSVL